MAVNTLGACCRESRIISRCRGVSICTKLTAISLHAREVLQCRRGASKKDPQIYYHTQTHPEFCSRFRIGVTNMFRAAVAISAMLGSVVSMLRCQTVLLLSPL